MSGVVFYTTHDGHPIHWPPLVAHPFTDPRLELARLGLPPLADDDPQETTP